ncbi:serine/arginine repetitive matrix protein 2 [Gallus gallus]|uniref:serine/arginine repetitive matrix protein 2 n=1 Tax=Gallus gallus TaxID=9031 RepID=UPI001AEA78F8|nr:serine/arginine repetitive matrix protein 2 [Gallus gallus]
MLIDPLVLKKKLNRMVTEQGAFAVLSSLLLYVTELAACDPQLRSKRTKWEEGKENQVSCKQSSPDSNRGCYPTRFQLLRSRFLNTNREPYVKKRREVGKLVIKERLWVNRAGNKLERRGDGKAAEEGEDTAPSERVRWGSVTGKNTVKNILKKFLAAEEKEDKEKIPIWKKKGPNSSLPKIVNRSSVLSKLKEQFEQSSLCSATEVKASLLRKGEKKMKTLPSRKAIRKPEVRVLRMAALAATDINGPESQYLVCSMVPVPRLSMATEINHPWSWSKNNATMQPCDHNTGLKEKENSERKPGENKTPLRAAQDMEDKEEPVASKEMPDAKDNTETNTDSSKQRPQFNSSRDSSFSIWKNKALADCDVLSSEHDLDCDRNKLPAGPDTSSPTRTTKAVQHVKDDSPPSNVPYSSTAEGSSEPSPQDTKTDEIPKIIMHVYSLEEADQDLTEPEKDPFFAGQKCFPEQEVLENTLPFYSPGDQALCEVEPPMQNRHLSHITQAASKRPLAVQKEAPGLRGRGSKEDKKGEKYHSEDKMYSTSSKNYSDISATKEQENKTPNCQMQNEPQTKQPQPPQMPSPQNHFSNSNAEISNTDANQTKPTLSSSDLQKQKHGVAEEHIPSDWDKKEGPLPDEFVRHKLYLVDEEFGKDQLPSANEMMSPSNNGVLDRSTFTDLETCYKPSNNFIECEETTADEVPWPDSEVWLSPSSNPVTTLMSGIVGQRIHHTLGNPPALPPTGLVTPGAGGGDDEYASRGSEKHPPPSSDESAVHENNAAVEKKTACDFNNQPLSPNHSTENEYAAAEETIPCQSLENCLSFSTKKIGKHANKTVLARNPLLPLERNQTQISDDTEKQGSDTLEENLFPSSELVSGQKKCAKGTDNVSKHEKHKPLPSDNDTKHGDDRMETEEREELDVLYKFEQEQVSTPSDLMDHDNNSSSGNNAHSPQTSQLPPSEHDTNIQGVKSSGQGLKCLAPTRDFIKRDHDLTADGNICCSNEKHQLPSSSEPTRRTNGTAGKRNLKLNFKDYSVLPRNTARHDDKTSDEENSFQDMKDSTVQHEKGFEGERNTSHDPKNQMPSSSPLVKQDKKFSPLDTRQQGASGDSVKPETKLAEKKTKHTSEKPQSPSNRVERPQERSSSAEKKQKAPEAEDVKSPETKAVTGDDEHQHRGQHQLPLSSKSAKPGKNVPGGEKQQASSEDFTMPDSNAKEKKKSLRPRKYRSVSSETAVLPQEKHSPDQKQQTPATAGFKKPETDVVKEKDEEPNSEKLPTPPSNKGVNFKEKNSSGERKQKMSAAGDAMPPKTKVAKEDDEHQHSGNQQLPPSSKPAKPGKKTPGEWKHETVTEGFRKPDTNSVKDKSKDPGSGMCQSSTPDLLLKLQEKNVTAKKKPSTPPSDKKIVDRTGSTEKRSGPRGVEEYQRQPSDKKGKHSIHSSGKEGSESYQTAFPSDGGESESDSVPKETNLSKTEKSSKLSPSRGASKYDDSPTESRKKQPGFKKYRALSAKGLMKDEGGTAGREAGWQAAGTASGRKVELGDCSKTAPFSKYTVESYSEGPLDSSFKPLIIRVTDTFKHHS